jgi:alkaline phosphatase D
VTERYDRRSFLLRAGLASAGAALPPLLVRDPAGAQPDPALAPFLHGVASGDPRPDGVVLWTRVATDSPDPVEVGWVVATDPQLQDVVASGAAAADPSRDHTVKVDVTGLSAGRWWFYGFVALGACSPVGRTKTAPEGSVDHLRFAVVSCSNYQSGYFNAYAALAERDDLDAVIHLGDYIYEGEVTETVTEGREHDPVTEVFALEEYRRRHGQYKLDPDLRRLHQLVPFITVWDDHEIANDAWREGAGNHKLLEDGEWAARKAAAQQAYDEWMPTRVEDPSTIYRSLAFGDLADLILLDTRLDGRDQRFGHTGATLLEERIGDPDRAMISDEQREFWYSELSASLERGTRWRLIGQQVMFAPLNLVGLPDLDGLLGVDLPDLPLFLDSGSANAVNPDQWDGYPAERQRFYDHLQAESIDNVVVLAGDIHTSWASNLTPDPYNPLAEPLAVEFVTTSVTSGGFEALIGRELALLAEPMVSVLNPHIRYADLTRRGYLILDVTPDRVQADWHHLETVRERSTAEEVGGSWKVHDGTNGLSRASRPVGPGDAAPATPPEGAACATPPAALLATSLAPEVRGSTTPAADGGAAAHTAEGATSSVSGQSIAATPASLPATGGGAKLVLGGALLGAAGLAHVVRRRAEVDDTSG